MKNTTIQIKIDNFEGPLDLLLHLIDKKQLKINEINITQIIDDYLKYIEEQKNSNLKIKVEFLVMATELVEIKAYSILNKNKQEEKLEDLEKRIIEYKFFKEISNLFSEYECEYNIPYNREGTQIVEAALVEYDLSKLTTDNLVLAFKNLLKNENMEQKLLLNLEDDYSMDDGFDEIEELFTINSKISFNNIFNKANSKAKVVSIFLCILELFKNGEINIYIDENQFYIEKIEEKRENV